MLANLERSLGTGHLETLAAENTMSDNEKEDEIELPDFSSDENSAEKQEKEEQNLVIVGTAC